jgi:hypothetical protein
MKLTIAHPKNTVVLLFSLLITVLPTHAAVTALIDIGTSATIVGPDPVNGNYWTTLFPGAASTTDLVDIDGVDSGWDINQSWAGVGGNSTGGPTSPDISLAPLNVPDATSDWGAPAGGTSLTITFSNVTPGNYNLTLFGSRDTSSFGDSVRWTRYIVSGEQRWPRLRCQ